MAGIEHIVVHSKSYLVRWIQVPDYHSISWSLQPNKKHINFGIFKHPGTKNGLSPNLPTQETVETTARTPTTPSSDGGTKPALTSRPSSVMDSSVVEKLQAVGLRSVAWQGRCEADRLTLGRYDVLEGEGGTYGLVFDNTFSKQTSKNVTFVLMTHPTNTPPKSGHHLHYALDSVGSGVGSGTGAANVGKGPSPSLLPVTDSDESLPHNLYRAVLEDPRPISKGGHGVESKGVEGTSFYTGILYKKRRKKGQGFTKRFFSLDFTSSTLSYYRNRHSSALRGAVPLSLAAVGLDEDSREFSVDSGAEVWHLKAINKKDFDGWKEALERASGQGDPAASASPGQVSSNAHPLRPLNPAEEREWERVEQLVSKVSGTRDAVRCLAKDTDPKYSSGTNGAAMRLTTSAGSSSGNVSQSGNDHAHQYFPEVDEGAPVSTKRPFWQRATSMEKNHSESIRKSISAQLAVPSPSLASGPTSPGAAPARTTKRPGHTSPSVADAEVHERCMALLRDLDSVVVNFSSLIAESKARRRPPLTTGSRLSLDSIDNQEFFDAEDGDASQLLNIRRSSERDRGRRDEQLVHHESEADSDSDSEAGDTVMGSAIFAHAHKASQSPLFPSKPDTLTPLPLAPVERRGTVPAPKQAPPSFIGFLRRNAGKDLSTISMPVTANEPTSLLQRLAETMEYSQLLDAAAGAESPSERLMFVVAFAVSYYSNNRAKERAIRKPFNPMLGETFELVREDLGFRFVAEKVSHHPVRMACQADSLNNGGWCYTQSPSPVQKFWGKSVELNNDGRARVVLHAHGEHYSWSQATCFLRNVIAGEKYVEPVQTMTVQNETNGMRAVATFKSGGVFSGRSEDVSVQLFDQDAALPLTLSGKWTENLKRSDTGATAWTVGSLVPDAPKCYGFTTFAAALNQVTEIEDGHLPPTDSRLRPDQQALEAGDADSAEALKARLEERQRARRKVLESHGQTWKPQFFEKASATTTGAKTDPDEEIWILKPDGGYWDKRAAGDWTGVQEVFET